MTYNKKMPERLRNIQQRLLPSDIHTKRADRNITYALGLGMGSFINPIAGVTPAVSEARNSIVRHSGEIGQIITHSVDAKTAGAMLAASMAMPIYNTAR